MNEQDWRDQRDDRTLRYAGRRFDPKQWIVVTIDPDYAERYDGQVALLTAANLLARMSPSVALAFSDVRVHSRLPWRNQWLSDVALSAMHASDPFGRFCLRNVESNDYRLHLGRTGNEWVAHGSGWNAYVGRSPSPLIESAFENPIGPALATVLAISQLFIDNLVSPPPSFLLNGYTWDNKQSIADDAALPTDLGNVWIAGAGSVGTAVLYFLGLSGRGFKPALIEMDVVKIHNLDRSPIFIADDVGLSKVKAAVRFLDEIGIVNVPADECPLHKSSLWLERPSGLPDVLVSAANEENVRYHIESRYPPIQLYATTGRNWQCSLIRHTPLIDPCSCCVFPAESSSVTMCASAPANDTRKEPHGPDAALPFLSFAAGIMTVSEIMKLSHAGYPFSHNRITLYTRGGPRLVPARLVMGANCLCQTRSALVHRRMIEGGRYAHLSALTSNRSR